MMLSPQAAAIKAGVSRKTIMNNIKSLELAAHRNNQNHWAIRPSDLANWMKAREERSPQVRSENTRDIPSSMFTSQHELDALRAQLELNFIKQRLEASEHDKEQLKKEVTELKAELKKTRADVNEVWRKFTEKLADFAKPHKKRSPFVLTKNMRVYGDDDEITNLFTD